MIKKISLGEFIQSFADFKRNDKFSISGLEALYEYLESTYGDEYKLDVITLCISFEEYKNLEEASEEYGVSKEELEDNFEIIKHSSGVIVASQ